VDFFTTQHPPVWSAKLVESLEGFEPSTRCLEGSRSVQLSYRDTQIKYSMIVLE
jgi:hypothetical protein